jgi:hypothetical protein
LTRPALRLLLLAVLAAAASLAVVAPAVAKAPCWKELINDWYDGRIDKTYAIHCYREAIDHLPTDVEQYSSARQDIERALQKRIADEKQGSKGKGGGKKTGVPPTPPPSTSGGSGSKGGGKPAKPGPGTTTNPNPTPPPATTTDTSPGRQTDGGPVGKALKKIGPKNADSVPIPLLVLAGVALLLLAAGAAGLIARRVQARRIPPIRPSGNPPPRA